MRKLALACAASISLGMALSNHGVIAAAVASAPLEVSLAPARASQGGPSLVDLAAGSPVLTVVLTNKGRHRLNHADMRSHGLALKKSHPSFHYN